MHGSMCRPASVADHYVYSSEESPWTPSLGSPYMQLLLSCVCKVTLHMAQLELVQARDASGADLPQSMLWNSKLWLRGETWESPWGH